ncbi:MAG: hypothetical protein FJY29_11985 [Betaproteobacteria bacterium]|nr:hypothetical protein [Betaproteobacteria bacterium]
MSQTSDQEPWYAPAGKKKPGATHPLAPKGAEEKSSFFSTLAALVMRLFKLRQLIFVLISLLGAAYLALRLTIGGNTSTSIIAFVIIFVAALFALLLMLRFLGAELTKVLPLHKNDSALTVAFYWLRNSLKVEEARRGPPAPELALSQFVSQVRSYASEKSFQNVRPSPERVVEPGSYHSESANLLKRRWNEVVDSLDEFEIYLANDPQGMIIKLVSKNPPKLIDAAVVFREVADSFDTTWRRKGINIESAIVTPLKATAHEGLLRRLLVGPWRASAYFARRGASVVFSAKSTNGRVTARWEVDGLSIPDDYLKVATDSALPVNDRIEKGLVALAPDPANSPNTLYALISFVTWIDLAHACEMEFEFKNTNNGFVIELRLK